MLLHVAQFLSILVKYECNNCTERQVSPLNVFL